MAESGADAHAGHDHGSSESGSGDSHDGHDHDAKSDPCFPSSGAVTLADGTAARVGALKEGDAIVAATADGSLTTGTVSVFSLDDATAQASFVVLSTTNGRTLTLTAEHHLPLSLIHI